MRGAKRHSSSKDPMSGFRGIVIGIILGAILWAIILIAAYYFVFYL